MFTPNPSAFSCEVVVVSQKRYDELMEHVASCAMSYSAATASSPKTSSDTGGRRQSNASSADDSGDGRTAVSSRLQAVSGAVAAFRVCADTVYFRWLLQKKKEFSANEMVVDVDSLLDYCLECLHQQQRQDQVWLLVLR